MQTEPLSRRRSPAPRRAAGARTHDGAPSPASPRVAQLMATGARLNSSARAEQLAATSHSMNAPVQRFWPLEYLASYVGLGTGDQEATPAEVRPGKYRDRYDHGKTHKPLKTKDEHERVVVPLIEGTGHEKAEQTEQTKPESGYFKHSTKVNWADFSTAGVKSDKRVPYAEKKDGLLRYDASTWQKTYERSPLVGYGIDGSYTMGPRESLSGSLATGKASSEYELIANWLKLSGKATGQVGSGAAGFEFGGKGSLEHDDIYDPRVDARVAAKAGAYLGEASGDVTAGFRIPWTNVMIGGGLTGKAAYGLGAAADASLKASMSEGLRFAASGSFVSGLGLGGGLMLNIGKYDKKRDWWGNEVPRDKQD